MNATSLRPVGRATVAAPAERPQLTSLVDMMVILVVFLLHSFSAEGQLVEPAPGLELPVSATSTPVPAGPQVVVGTEWIEVDGRRITATTEAAAGELVTAALAGGSGRPLLIQVDRRVAYRLLGVVLQACAAAGWTDVSLVVQGGES